MTHVDCHEGPRRNAAAELPLRHTAAAAAGVAVLFLLRFIWTFNAFDEIFLLTGGAAGTQVVSLEIFEQLFGRSDVGAEAALSIVLALILAVALFLYFRFFYREEAA